MQSLFFSSYYYWPVLALQAFCLYHAYKNNTGQKWYLLIIFLPVIGCLIYFYENFYSRQNLENLTEGVKSTIFTNYQIEKLEKEVKFTETVTNKMLLADAYVQHGRHADAIKLYESCTNPPNGGANSPDLLRKLLKANYLSKNYGEVVRLGKLVEGDKNFRVSEDKIGFAWSLHYTGKTSEAEEKFREMDVTFRNFRQRLEFSRFLVATSRPAEAKTKLQEMLEEYSSMGSYEQSLKKNEVREIKNYLRAVR